MLYPNDNKNKIIPGKISREIMRAVIDNNDFDNDKFSEYIAISDFEKLKNLYNTKLKLLDEKNNPRHLPFYYLIKDKLPNFFWESHLKNDGKNQVKITAPKVGNKRISLINFLLEKLDFESFTILEQKYKCVKKLDKQAILALDKFIKLAKVIYSNEKAMSNVIDWILHAKLGEPATIFIPLCPDYSVELTGDESCPYRHNFNTVGTGNGQIAQQILNILHYLEMFLRELEICPRIVVAIADFEAFSKENLNRMNLSKSEFINRIDQSRKAFKAKMTLTNEIFMFTDLCGGEQSWLDRVQRIKDEFNQGKFGVTNITQKALLQMTKNRLPLYSRWYGKKESLQSYVPILLSQGAEYAAMGSYLAEQFDNCLVLGADNNIMGDFYSFKKIIPTIYLKRVYC